MSCDGRLGDWQGARVALVERGTNTVIFPLENVVATGDFVAEMGKTGTAKVVALLDTEGKQTCCPPALADRELRWCLELVVWWGTDASGEPCEAWRGPITNVRWGFGTVSIEARDISAYLERALLIGTDADLVGRWNNEPLETAFRSVIEFVNVRLERAGCPRIRAVTQPTGLTIDRERDLCNPVFASDLLTELGKAGLTWAAIGDTIYAGNQIQMGPPVVFGDDVWSGTPTIVEDGTTQANSVAVFSTFGQSDGNCFVRVATNDETGCCPIWKVEKSDSLTRDGAQQRADELLAQSLDPVSIEPASGVLSPDAPFSLCDVTPGSLVQVASSVTCREVTGLFKVGKVKGNLKGGISVTLVEQAATVGAATLGEQLEAAGLDLSAT